MTLAPLKSISVPDNQAAVTTWVHVQSAMKSHFGEAVYKSWLQSLNYVETKNGQVILSAPTRFIREWVLSHYSGDILLLWQQVDNTVKALDVYLRRPKASSEEEVSANFGVEGENVRPLPVDHHVAQDAYDLSSPLDARFTLEYFMVGDSNRLAYNTALQVVNSGKPLPGLNPFYVYGEVGFGKTHLLHAMAAAIRQQHPQRKVVYLSAEKFMFLFVRAIRQNEIMRFKEQLRSVDVLLIDDIQFISGKGGTQDEFFHTFNSLLDNQRQVIISGDRPPFELKDMEERIRSRLSWGMVADVKPADQSLRLAIIESKLKQMQLVMPNHVMEFLASKITTSIRELEGALNKVVAHSHIMEREITLEGAKEILFDLLRSSNRAVTIDDIQKLVADHFQISIQDLCSDRRLRSVARPRQIAMYLSKQLTTRSLTEIARRFRRRDHTTVLHAIKTVEDIASIDSEFDREVQGLMKRVRG